jgi:predicted dehydrogenase
MEKNETIMMREMNMPASGLNLLVIGAGSIGRRHARNLLSLGAAVYLFDVNSDLLTETCSVEGFIPCPDLGIALRQQQIDAALVCTPTHLHIPIAMQVAGEGIDLFIEKPLSHSLDGVDELIQTVNARNIIAMMGFMLRYEPGLRYLKEHVRKEDIAFAQLEFGSHMPLWRKGVDYRTVYSANRSMGGGTILDDVHELDYACWLLGYPGNVTAVSGTFSSFDIDVEDTAMIIFGYPDKIVSIHSDYLQRRYSRGCKLVDREGYSMEWIFGDSVVIHDSRGKHTFSYADSFDVNQLYIDEMRHFLDCIRSRTRPESDLENARDIMKIALAAKHEYPL